jgi:hypothetical protein
MLSRSRPNLGKDGNSSRIHGTKASKKGTNASWPINENFN